MPSTLDMFRKQVLDSMTKNYNRKVRICMCGCGKTFTSSSKAHFFKSPKCYSRYHRLPGQVRLLMNSWKD